MNLNRIMHTMTIFKGLISVGQFLIEVNIKCLKTQFRLRFCVLRSNSMLLTLYI